MEIAVFGLGTWTGLFLKRFGPVHAGYQPYFAGNLVALVIDWISGRRILDSGIYAIAQDERQ